MFSITGKLVVKGDAEQVTDTFKKREFVINDDGKYPQEIMFQLVQDKCDLIDPYNIGQEIEVSFNLRGRRWENPKTKEVRFFNTLDAWKVSVASQPSLSNNLPPVEQTPKVGSDESDDLPF